MLIHRRICCVSLELKTNPHYPLQSNNVFSIFIVTENKLGKFSKETESRLGKSLL
jgi:hypothetical protein